MAEQMQCLRCQVPIELVGEEDFRIRGQVGFAGMLLGSLNQLMEDVLALQMFRCPKCGHVEFFLPGS